MSMSVASFPNGIVRHMPSLEYVQSPEKVLAENGELLCTDVWLAATDSDRQAYSRFRRYYWASPDVGWLPMEMDSLNARERKADPFF